MGLYLTGDRAADELLETDAFALLVGLALDQQIPLERAFLAPYQLRERLGGRLDAKAVASMDPEALRAAFAQRPALHRFPSAMAARVQQLARVIVERFGGDAGRIWNDADSGAGLLERVRSLPGFGDQKARISVALLGKRIGVRPPGWREAAGGFAEPGTSLSIADVDSAASLERVRAHKRDVKAALRGLACPPGDSTPRGASQASEPAAPRPEPGGRASTRSRH